GWHASPRCQVSACRKAALAGAAEDDHPHLSISCERPAGGGKVLGELVVDRVEHLGPIQNQMREVALALEQDGAAHAVASSGSCCPASASSRIARIPLLIRTG